MNDENANIVIFTLVTLIPMAAAARSFPLTANITRPDPARRTLATATQSNTRITTRNTPKTGRETLSPKTRPKSHEPSRGFGTFAPPDSMSPMTAGFLKTNSAMVTPPARVMMAKFVPRTRKAGNPTKSPKTIAPSAARNGAIGKGTSYRIANFDNANPATPAKAICAREVCPPKPVRTTSDNASTDAISVVIIAARHRGPKANRPTTARTMGTRTDTGVTRACGTEGNFQLLTAPRSGSRSPSTTMVTMMTRKGIPSRAPYSGNQLISFCNFVQID